MNESRIISELDTASSALKAALQHYTAACLLVKHYYQQNTDVPQALSNRVAQELYSAISYETKICRAKSNIGQARNHSSRHVHIHSLPTEILARVFSILVGERPCELYYQDGNTRITSFPRYPDHLSHVCSRWRQIALSLPQLWSHIDIVHMHSLTPGFLERAKACAVRANQLNLDIHLRIPFSYEESDDISIAMLDFLATNGARMGGFEFIVPHPSDELDSSILLTCFKNFVPGRLTKLVLQNHGSDSPAFLSAIPADPDLGGGLVWLDLPYVQFEWILRQITVLQLDGLYPLWISQAYHGLVELRLTCTRIPDAALITASQLHYILLHSPKLRVLEIDIPIDTENQNQNSISLSPVYLNELESLSLEFLGYSDMNMILGLIHPVPHLFQLAIHHDTKNAITSEDNVTRFLKESAITRLYVGALDQHTRLEEILGLVPSLRVLALKELEISTPPEASHTSTTHVAIPPSPFRLDALYLLECRIDLDLLQQKLRLHPVHKLVLWGSTLLRNNDTISVHDAIDELSVICPVVALAEDDSSPVAPWWD